jgi:cytochrome c biogenesis protein
MRVALVLLFLLALAAVPGSLIPQSDVNPPAVQEWVAANPGLAVWADRLDLFSVYSSPWFSAVYLLLMVSLVGCILPRAMTHARALRAAPPRAPRMLGRLPAHREVTASAGAAELLQTAEDVLRAQRFRVAADREAGWVSAEKGYAKEAGNLVFHVAVVVVLVAVAVGALFGYRGSVLVVEGNGFANLPIQYDSISLGPRVDEAALPPFSLTLDEFVMDFVEEGPTLGAPADFEAQVTFVPEPGAAAEPRVIRVNEPLSVDGSLVHLLNPGYAPVVSITGPDGATVFSDAVPFLPQDENFTSTGVVKAEVPGQDDADLGLQGIFLPTAIIGAEGPASLFPEPRNPALFITAFRGDLGLDDGLTQSIYRLETTDMTQLESEPGEPFRVALGVGESAELPDGAGTVTFEGYRTWVNLQVSRNAGKEVALLGTVLMIAGMVVTFAVRRRRLFVRLSDVDAVDAARRGDATVVVGGLDRDGSDDLQVEVDDLAQELSGQREESPRDEH